MTDEVRDRRLKGWSWFDNRVMTRLAAEIGPHALCVYMALVSHSDEQTQTCYPSYQALAKELGISRPTVVKAIETLIHAKLIKKDTRRASPGDNDTNLYTLLNILGVVNDIDPLVNEMNHGGKPDLPPSKPDLPPSKPDLPGVVNQINQGGKPDLPGVVNDVYPNKTQYEQDSVNKKKADSLPTSSKSARPKKCLCPVDYAPSQALKDQIAKKYYRADIETLVDAMRDWSTSKGEKREDWDATLRTFARRDWVERGSPQAPGQKKLELQL